MAHLDHIQYAQPIKIWELLSVINEDNHIPRRYSTNHRPTNMGLLLLSLGLQFYHLVVTTVSTTHDERIRQTTIKAT